MSYAYCRHVMISGKQCFAPALRGTNFCYFHTGMHQRAKQKTEPDDPIEIPVLEDRCAIQLVVSQVLRAPANSAIDHKRASLLLYGLQLASQNVDRGAWAVPVDAVQAITQTPDGDVLGVKKSTGCDDDDEEDDDEDEDDDE